MQNVFLVAAASSNWGLLLSAASFADNHVPRPPNPPSPPTVPSPPSTTTTGEGQGEERVVIETRAEAEQRRKLELVQYYSQDKNNFYLFKEPEGYGKTAKEEHVVHERADSKSSKRSFCHYDDAYDSCPDLD